MFFTRFDRSPGTSVYINRLVLLLSQNLFHLLSLCQLICHLVKIPDVPREPLRLNSYEL